MEAVLEKLKVRSAHQQFPCLLWKPKIHYGIHSRWSPFHIMSQMNLSFHPPIRSILILSYLLELGLLSGVSSLGTPTKTSCERVTFLLRATCPNHKTPLFVHPNICRAVQMTAFLMLFLASYSHKKGVVMVGGTNIRRAGKHCVHRA
jgi:hypothetical protein